MSASLRQLIWFVLTSSLVAAGLLTTCMKVEPERSELARRFTYFFARCFVTIGFWAALLWYFSDGAEHPAGLP